MKSKRHWEVEVKDGTKSENDKQIFAKQFASEKKIFLEQFFWYGMELTSNV